MGEVTLSKEKRFKKQMHKDILFVVTSHPLLTQLVGLIQKYSGILYMNIDVKKIFTRAPMVSFRSFHKISSFLVRANLCTFQTELRDNLGM